MDVQDILSKARERGGARFVCAAPLHLTADGRVVSEGDPDGRYVLVGPGGSLPLELAKELGLDRPPVKIKAPKEDSATARGAHKAIRPQENKMIQAQDDKAKGEDRV